MSRFALFLARFASSAWIGAAALFVVVGVSEVVHPGFGSDIRDQLVVIRFPWYYRGGVILMAVALLGALAASRSRELAPWPWRLSCGLLATALAVFLTEYFVVYCRLAELVTPPGKPRTPEFMTFHRWSMWINLADLLLCLLAAGLLNWPGTRVETTPGPRESDPHGNRQLDSASATSVR